MPLELKRLLNRPVISVTTGRQMGTVNKLLFEPQSYSLYGFGVRPKQKDASELVLLRGNVKAIGPDAITIASDDKVSPLAEDLQAAELVSLGSRLKGKPIVTEDGNHLGKLTTFLLTEDGGIKALHASSGILGFGGGKDIQPGSILVAGQDAIIVSSRPEAPPQELRLAA